MIRNAFTGESWTLPKSLAQQETDFTAEGSPAPGDVELKRQADADEAAKVLLRAAVADAATIARVASTARWAAAGSAPAAGIPRDDWDALFSAVTYRLLATVGESQTSGAAAPWEASVLECVDALDQLQANLSRAVAAQGEFARREPDSTLPELPLLDSPQLPLDLSSVTTAPPATGAAGLGSRETEVPG